MAQSKTKVKPDNGDNQLPLEARAIQCIVDFPAPATSQDTVDQLAAEYMTAALLRTQAEKRYERVKRIIGDEFSSDIAKTRNDAAEHMEKALTAVVGNEWQLHFVANKPATRVDVDELRTELVRIGINADKIDKAIAKVSKKATPALIITAKLVV